MKPRCRIGKTSHSHFCFENMNLQPNIELKILDQRIADQLPAFGTDHSAGLDLRACIEAPLTIEPGQCHLIPAGFSMHIADPGLCAMLLPRSGLGHKNGIVLGNGTGLIDADYQGPMMVSCFNRGTEAFTIQPLDRIAQMVIVPIARPTFTVVEEFGRSSQRGEGGFGSTGKS